MQGYGLQSQSPALPIQFCACFMINHHGKSVFLHCETTLKKGGWGQVAKYDEYACDALSILARIVLSGWVYLLDTPKTIEESKIVQCHKTRKL